jgi:hypothetical protein
MDIGYNDFSRPIALQPREAGAADDRQQPRARVDTAETLEKPECAEAGLLHHVFGIVIVACEPTR